MSAVPINSLVFLSLYLGVRWQKRLTGGRQYHTACSSVCAMKMCGSCSLLIHQATIAILFPKDQQI